MLDHIINGLKSKNQLVITVCAIVGSILLVYGVTQLEAFMQNWLDYVTVSRYETEQAEMKGWIKDAIREGQRELLNDFETRYHDRRRTELLVPPIEKQLNDTAESEIPRWTKAD